MYKKKKPAKPEKIFIKNINRAHNTSFSKLHIRKKLLQELGEKIAIIMSNPDNSEIFNFIKFI